MRNLGIFYPFNYTTLFLIGLLVGFFVVIRCYNQKYCLLQASQDCFGKHGKKMMPPAVQQFSGISMNKGSSTLDLKWCRNLTQSHQQKFPYYYYFQKAHEKINKLLHVNYDCLWMTNPFLSLASYIYISVCVRVFATILRITSKCSRYLLTLLAISQNLNTRITCQNISVQWSWGP